MHGASEHKRLKFGKGSPMNELTVTNLVCPFSFPLPLSFLVGITYKALYGWIQNADSLHPKSQPFIIFYFLS